MNSAVLCPAWTQKITAGGQFIQSRPIPPSLPPRQEWTRQREAIRNLMNLALSCTNLQRSTRRVYVHPALPRAPRTGSDNPCTPQPAPGTGIPAPGFGDTGTAGSQSPVLDFRIPILDFR